MRYYGELVTNREITITVVYNIIGILNIVPLCAVGYKTFKLTMR